MLNTSGLVSEIDRQETGLDSVPILFYTIVCAKSIAGRLKTQRPPLSSIGKSGSGNGEYLPGQRVPTVGTEITPPTGA